MSTSYYRLKPPITKLELIEGPVVDILGVWESNLLAGSLNVSKHGSSSVILMFADEVEDWQCPMRTHFGGADVGCVVTQNDASVQDDAQLISEYGDLVTVGQIKEYAGRGKRKDT